MAQQSGQGQVSRLAVDFGSVFIQRASLFIALLAAFPVLLKTAAGRGACIMFVLIGGIWLSFVPQYVYSRYYIGVIALAIILAGAVLAAILELLPRRAHVIELVLMLYLLPNALLAFSSDATLARRNRAAETAFGSISRASYLTAQVRVFAAESWINARTPPGARIAVVGTTSSYYLDRTYLADYYRARYQRLLVNRVGRNHELATWCSTGVQYVLLDLGVDEFDQNQNPTTVMPSRLQWLNAFTQSPRLLYSAHGLEVLSVNPCSLK